MSQILATLIVLGSFSSNAFSADMPYQDNEFSCITQEQAARYVDDFKINVKSFGGLELCDSKVETKKLFNDLQIIENGSFVVGTNNPYIRGFVDAKNYYAWMQRETRGIKRGNDIPYATAYNSGGYFTMQDGWAKLSTLGRVGTVIHEARHTAGYRHISCTQGSYQGSNVAGCDSTYNYGGSHAIEMEYYARVAVQGTNFHPVYKKMARLMAIARSNIFFNTAVITPREAVLALSEDRKTADLYDQGKWFSRETPNVNGKLKRTSFGAVLFDGLNAFAIELYQNSGFADVISDTYSYYKLLADKNETLKDFEEFDVGVKRYAVKITRENKLSAYDFPNGDWGRELTLPFEVSRVSTSVLDKTQSGLYLISTGGDIYNYNPQTQKVSALALKWNPEFKEVVSYKGQNLALHQNGHIFVQNAQGISPWSETNNVYSDLIPTTLYNGFEVNKE